MESYVKALYAGDLRKAQELLYLPSHFDHPGMLQDHLGQISRRLRESGCQICVSDSRRQTRMALVIYGSCNQDMLPQLVFLILDARGHWKLHNLQTAGPLKDALKDRHDFLAARELALWGAKRMEEIHRQRVPAEAPGQTVASPLGGVL